MVSSCPNKRNVRQRGFTLLEMLVAVGILGAIGSLVGQVLVQSIRSQRTIQADVTTNRYLRNSVSWYSRDTPNATVTDLVDGAAPSAEMMVEWPDADGVAHTVAYRLEDGVLVREVDGAENILARHVTAVEFTRAGQVLNMNLTLTPPGAESSSKGLAVFARMLE